MNQANNWIVFVRGNHDNPAYFDGATFYYKRFIAVPDYTILQACNHTILCVGGAISIDRIYRINEWNKRKYRVHSNEAQENESPRKGEWQNERIEEAHSNRSVPFMAYEHFFKRIIQFRYTFSNESNIPNTWSAKNPPQTAEIPRKALPLYSTSVL